SCESTGFEQFKVTLTSIGAVAFAFDDTKMFAAPFDKVSGPSAIHVGPRVPVDGGFAQISATPGLALEMDVSSTHIFVRTLGSKLFAVPIGGGDAGPQTTLDGGLTGIKTHDGVLVYRNADGVFTCVPPQCTAVTELVPAAT